MICTEILLYTVIFTKILLYTVIFTKTPPIHSDLYQNSFYTQLSVPKLPLYKVIRTKTNSSRGLLELFEI